MECNCKVSHLDLESIPKSCPLVWNLLGSGHTKGIFQVESKLGSIWCKKIQPQSIQDLGAIIAVIRPGCMESYEDDGKNLTEHYYRRKQNIEQIPDIHPAINKILADTYNILIYQEQAIFLAKGLAGFNNVEADLLRIAIGKKLPIEMAKVEHKFMEGVEKQGIITTELAQKVFGWIKASQRYSLNKAHAMGYGKSSYISAWIKAHYPINFFKSWLKFAEEKPKPREEIDELINDAKIFNVKVEPPNIFDKQKCFYIKDNVVKFGLVDIKGIGEAQYNRIIDTIDTFESAHWYVLLTTTLSKLTEKNAELLISSGAVRSNVPRKQMLYELKIMFQLTDRELEWVHQNWSCANNLVDLLFYVSKPKKNGGPSANKNRSAIIDSLISMLKDPPYEIKDSPLWISSVEKDLLGSSLTYTKIDSCDDSDANCTCLGFHQIHMDSYLIAAEIKNLRQNRIKNGDNAGLEMAYVSLMDSTGSVDAIAWPECYKEYKSLLETGNTVIVKGYKNKKDKNSLILQECWQI